MTKLLKAVVLTVLGALGAFAAGAQLAPTEYVPEVWAEIAGVAFGVAVGAVAFLRTKFDGDPTNGEWLDGDETGTGV
jgi:hypothetical protein